jgi:hypothetical protein
MHRSNWLAADARSPLARFCGARTVVAAGGGAVSARGAKQAQPRARAHVRAQRSDRFEEKNKKKARRKWANQK